MEKALNAYIRMSKINNTAPSVAGFKKYLLDRIKMPITQLLKMINSKDWEIASEQLNIYLEEFLVDNISQGKRNSQGMVFLLRNLPGYSNDGAEINIKPPVFNFDIGVDKRIKKNDKPK